MERLRKFEQITEKQRKKRIMKKTVFGIVALLVGLLLLGFNLEILNPEWRHIVFSWQMLLIAIGLINVFDKDSLLTGIILLSVGSIFLIPEFAVVPFKVKQVFWPILIIFIGLAVIAKHRFPFFNHKSHRYQKYNRINKNFTASDIDESGTIQQTNIFGGSRRIFNNTVFRGGKITNIFGGGEIDLRNTELAEGRVVLDITSIFGGMNVIVPSHWIVNLEVDSVLGGFQDKRIIIPGTDENSSDSELIIVGFAVFGGGELRSA